LGEERRFTDTWIAANQYHCAAHNAAAKNAIELSDTGGCSALAEGRWDVFKT
jgi:hypothetical protein